MVWRAIVRWKNKQKSITIGQIKCFHSLRFGPSLRFPSFELREYLLSQLTTSDSMVMAGTQHIASSDTVVFHFPYYRHHLQYTILVSNLRQAGLVSVLIARSRVISMQQSKAIENRKLEEIVSLTETQIVPVRAGWFMHLFAQHLQFSLHFRLFERHWQRRDVQSPLQLHERDTIFCWLAKAWLALIEALISSVSKLTIAASSTTSVLCFFAWLEEGNFELIWSVSKLTISTSSTTTSSSSTFSTILSPS